MGDCFTKQQRSWMMGRVHGKDTQPERMVRRLLHARGFRFRIHCRDLPGKPDIVLPKYHTVVFVHGCFWHGHPGCKRATIPTTNQPFWSEKIGRNKERDATARRALRKAGWQVVTVWQCEIKKPERLERSLKPLLVES